MKRESLWLCIGYCGGLVCMQTVLEIMGPLLWRCVLLSAPKYYEKPIM